MRRGVSLAGDVWFSGKARLCAGVALSLRRSRERRALHPAPASRAVRGDPGVCVGWQGPPRADRLRMLRRARRRLSRQGRLQSGLLPAGAVGRREGCARALGGARRGCLLLLWKGRAALGGCWHPRGTARALAEGTTAELGAALIRTERKPRAARSGLPSVLHIIISQLTSWSGKDVVVSRVLRVVVEAPPTSSQ